MRLEMHLMPNHNNERICALEHLKHAEQHSLNIYDRGYFSFELLVDHVKHNIDAVFRLQSNTKYKEIEDFWVSEENWHFVPPQADPHHKTFLAKGALFLLSNKFVYYSSTFGQGTTLGQGRYSAIAVGRKSS